MFIRLAIGRTLGITALRKAVGSPTYLPTYLPTYQPLIAWSQNVNKIQNDGLRSDAILTNLEWLLAMLR